MLCSPVEFMFLTTVLNSTLIVTKPQEADTCYITLDYNEERYDSWPTRWTSMDTKCNNYCQIDLRKQWN